MMIYVPAFHLPSRSCDGRAAIDEGPTDDDDDDDGDNRQ